MKPGPELYSKNLRLMAERDRWPAGAVEAVERLVREHPGWLFIYSHGGTARWRDAGFYAYVNGPCMDGKAFMRKDPAELDEALANAPVASVSNRWVPPGGWLQY